MKQYILLTATLLLFGACSAQTSDRKQVVNNTKETAYTPKKDSVGTAKTLSSVKKDDVAAYKINLFSAQDTAVVNRILREAAVYNKQNSIGDVILFVGRKFIGKPYVAHTLDRTDDEQLVVNLQQLDCTTYLENVLALVLASYKPNPNYETFLKQLKDIRYRQGILGYENRLHYFDWWLEDNEAMGFVHEVKTSEPPFTAVQTLKINYMSEHSQAYSMLKNHPERVESIKLLENKTNGKQVVYIPKAALKNTALLRKTIKDGDIIALVTNKKNLDTTHLGLAVWHKDGLHLLNASSLKKNGKQVVEPEETLYQYLMARPWNTGIRVARVVEP